MSDSADPAAPAPGSADAFPEGLEAEGIREVHLESDFATLHASTPGKRFLEIVAVPESRWGQQDSYS